MICIYEMHLLIILLAHLHMLMSFYDVKSRLKCNIFCPRNKVFFFLAWMGVIICNDFNIMYSNALSYFMFETNYLKIIVIWFINWSQAFKLLRKHDLFFTKSHEIPKNIYIFDLKIGMTHNNLKCHLVWIWRSWHVGNYVILYN